MRITAVIAFVACLVSPVVCALADDAGVETVLVTGEQPGPSLWEVTDGEHSLWILASYAPLPSGLKWKSKEVETIIAQAQEVLGAYQASFAVDGPEALRAKNYRLKRVLPRKQYQRWLTLRKKYIGQIETEDLLPASAATLLRVSALERSGLVYTDDLWRTIYGLAHKYGVPVSIEHQVTIPIPANTRTAKDQQRIGVDYLIETMSRIEDDVRAAVERANAWAVGDIDVLRELAKADGAYAAMNAHSWPFLQGEQLNSALTLVDKKWVAAATATLKRNRISFAVLPAYLVFEEDGPLSVLKSAGYVILEPEAGR
jgi:hypothetical protein